MNKNYIEIQFDGTTLSYDEIMSLVDRNKEKIKLDRVWKATISKIPTLNFKEDWDVKVIPCFGGVVARFITAKNGKEISVYLDMFGQEGGQYGEPYWEAYHMNNNNGEHPERFDIDDTRGLLDYISKVLD